MDHKAKEGGRTGDFESSGAKRGQLLLPQNIRVSQLTPQDVDEKEDEIIRVPKLIVTAMKFLTVGREWAQQQISTCP